MKRRGDMFIFMLNIFFLFAIILIFSKLHAAFTLQNPGEGIGTRQAALLHTYAMSEQMLLYVDEAAKFAAYESLATTMEHGAGNLATPRCPEKYAGYNQWTRANEPHECFPDTGKSGTVNPVYEAFKKEMQVNLRKYLGQYPGFPAGVTYDIKLEQGNGLRVIGITRDQITFPIVAVKDARQQAITPLLRQDSVAKTALDFTPDTTLQAQISPSVNGRPRIGRPTNITIQATLTADAVTARKQYTDGLLSTHYLIDEQGTLTQVIPEDQRAFICEGSACARIEEAGIIISLVNQGAVPDQLEAGKCKSPEFELGQPNWCPTCKPACYEKYTKEQLATLEALLVDIIKRNGMPVQNTNLREQLLKDGNPGPALRAGADQRQWLADLLTRVAAKSRASNEAVTDAGDAANAAQDTSGASSTTSNARVQADLGVVLPLDDARLTSCFGARNLAGHENHGGIDFGVPVGTPIRAIADGTVKKQCDDCPGTRGFGKNVLITHPNGMLSHYSHLSVINVNDGQQVKRGEIIGLSGNTGSSTGPHLHFAIFTHDVTAPLSREASNALCVFPDEQLARIKGKPYNCRFAEMSHNDPDFSQACAGVAPMKSIPTCGFNGMPLDAGGDVEVSATLAKLKAIDQGFPDVISKIAEQEGVDPKLVTAVISTESGGDPSLLNQYGAVGLGQLKPDAANDMGIRPVNPACKCARGNCKASSVPACAGDARTNPEQNARGTARYLKWLEGQSYLNGKSDKTRLVIAAYNQGPGTIKNAIEKTGKEDPTWEEVALHVNEEGRNYVVRVSSRYVALGGSVQNAFSDMECNNFNVKEMGTYSFAPAFTVVVPDLLTAVDRTAVWAKETYAVCDDSTQSCLDARIDRFNRESADLGIAQCEEPPQAALMELQQVLIDCQQNRQDNCACAWKPTAVDEVAIQLAGSRGMPQASLYTAPTDTHGELKTAMIKQGQIIPKAVVLRTGNATITISEPDGSDPQTFTVDEFRFLKTASGIVLTLDDEQACGDYKTTYPVCVQVKQPIPLLSKGSELQTPKIKFALWLDDRKPPEAVQQLTATTTAGITIMFQHSPSEDVSYYKVACSASGVFSERDEIFINARKDGKRIGEPVAKHMLTCAGTPVASGGSYKVRVVPYDLAGNKGAETIAVSASGTGGVVGAGVGAVAGLGTGSGQEKQATAASENAVCRPNARDTPGFIFFSDFQIVDEPDEAASKRYSEFVDTLLCHQPGFIISGGDNIDDCDPGTPACVESPEDYWPVFNKHMAPLLERYTPGNLYSVHGNHDLQSSSDTPAIFMDDVSIDRDGIHFVFLKVTGSAASAYITTDTEPTWDQQWLEQDLKAAAARDAFIVVVMHQPPYTSDPNWQPEDSEFVKKQQEMLVPLFEKYGVSMVLAGHFHNYERISKNGITYVVAGGGGGELQPGGKLSDENAYRHFIKFDKLENPARLRGTLVIISDIGDVPTEIYKETFEVQSRNG